MILQLRHATFITQSLKEIHSGRETGLIDTGPLGPASMMAVIPAFNITASMSESSF